MGFLPGADRRYALNTFHNQLAGKRTAPAVFDGVAQLVYAGRFTHDAIVDDIASGFERFNHFHGAVVGIAFFVRGDEQGNRTGMIRCLARNSSMAVIKRQARSSCPLRRVRTACRRARLVRTDHCPIFRPGRWDYIGMPRKTHDRRCIAATRPEIISIAETHFFDFEAKLFKAFNQNVLAACIVRSERAPRNQRLGKFDGLV